MLITFCSSIMSAKECTCVSVCAVPRHCPPVRANIDHMVHNMKHYYLYQRHSTTLNTQMHNNTAGSGAVQFLHRSQKSELDLHLDTRAEDRHAEIENGLESV